MPLPRLTGVVLCLAILRTGGANAEPERPAPQASADVGWRSYVEWSGGLQGPLGTIGAAIGWTMPPLAIDIGVGLSAINAVEVAAMLRLSINPRLSVGLGPSSGVMHTEGSFMSAGLPWGDDKYLQWKFPLHLNAEVGYVLARSDGELRLSIGVGLFVRGSDCTAQMPYNDEATEGPCNADEDSAGTLTPYLGITRRWR